ncbi:hypothetical protein ITJ86_16520 [Winogradskyella sp. F6397]|uniref:Lysozyme inhibitor n=1 Tax=Winogradskyella marina TaxID=2785530 RepID=A0ABS0EM99_9FLAO|nr:MULTISPECIES: hypothetical protein [Winogradskyella]MBF8151509.1 hypothetical protein [Winogradskyella marina]
MKRLFVTASLILAIGMNCYSQNQVNPENELTYSCDEMVKQNPENETITLIGNANLKTSVFEFENADKIVLNKKTKEIFVIGGYKVHLNGGTITQQPKSEKKWLRYKIGENVAYVE